MAVSTDDRQETAVLRVADAVGGLMEFWGFKRAMGRMWTVLYLTPEPLAAQDLGQRIRMSAGSVSMTLQELIKWGVVKKAWRPGERRDYYEPETSIWKMVSRVFRERELIQIRGVIETFEDALGEIDKASQRRSSNRKKLRFMRDRVESLLGLARTGEALLTSIIEGQQVDPSPIKSFTD